MQWTMTGGTHQHLTAVMVQLKEPINDLVQRILVNAKNLWNPDPCCNMAKYDSITLLSDDDIYSKERQSLYAIIETQQAVTFHDHFTGLINAVENESSRWRRVSDCTLGDTTTMLQLYSEHVSILMF